MPFRKKYGKRKRYRTKRKYGNPRTLQVSGMNSPLPRKFVTKLIYADNGTIDPAIGQVGDYVFSCNGLYDPNITGAGHQPRGFDQLMLMYDHYIVLGAKIVVRFSNPNNASAIMAGIAIRDQNTNDPNVLNWEEDSYIKKTVVSSNAGSAVASLAHSVNPNKFLSRSKPLSDPQLKGDVGNNPTEQAYFHVGMWPLDGASNLSVCAFAVQIEYIVAFIEPKIVGES